MTWEIVHVPGKIQISLEESLVDVLAANVDPKLANNIVRKLNHLCPLQNLRHVKRVWRRIIEGEVELSVIICLACKDDNHMGGLTNEINQFVNTNQLSLFNAKVAKNPASSKEGWEEQCKLWPISYHPPTNPDGIAAINDEESDYIFKYMKMAILSTKLSSLSGSVVNSAVIVDPLSEQVIASASDEVSLLPTSIYDTSSRHDCEDCNRENVKSHQSDNNVVVNSQEATYPWWRSCKCVYMNSPVSCLNPWGWMEQRHNSFNSLIKCDSNYAWHPLRHAAFVAIEKAAERDRQLFPGSKSKTQVEIDGSLNYCFNNSPTMRQKIQDDSLVEKFSCGDLPTETLRPYLCTGFDIYLVWEPCTMCAMALVHQRIGRIFFAFPNPNSGALGSIYRLQGEKNLNHHYSVFRIIVPEKALHEIN